MSTRRSPEEPALSPTPLRRQRVEDPRRGWRWLTGLIVVAHCGLAGATEAADTAELARIARARAAVEHDARVAQAACAERFAVASCIERVKAERHERVQKLNRERAAIDDERRKQRATERAAAQDQRKADRTEPSPGNAARLAKPPASAPTPMPARRADTAQREVAAAKAEAAAARRAEASPRRAEQARVHREAVERRNQVNAAAKAPSKPLPVPPAASAVP